MAGQLLTFKVTDEGGGNKPHTIVQIVAPDDRPIDLFAIECMPLGSAGQTVPLEFDLCVQSDAGGSHDASAELEVLPPAAGEGVNTVIRRNFSTEPQTSTPKASFTLHQQRSRTWVPPVVPWRIAGGTRLGLRYLSSQEVKCKFLLNLRE